MKNLLIAACLALCTSLEAATFNVTNLNDSGAGSLRQAVIDAEAAAGADNIIFNATLNGTISLLTALPDITQDLTLEGPTAANSNVNVARAGTAAASFRIFTIVAATVTVSDLTIADGNVTGAPAQGGGIHSTGILTLTRCVIRDCVATGDDGATGGQEAQGGGIFSSGTLTLTDCEIMDCETHGGAATTSGNGGAASGGGIYMGGGQLVMVRCRVGHCHSDGGQGVASHGAGDAAGLFLATATVRDSDIHGNEARNFHAPAGGGAAVVVASSVTILRSSICESVGSGLKLNAATTLRNVTVSGNQGGNVGGVEIDSAVTVVIDYCTITGNSGSVGGVRLPAGNTGQVEGSIIAGNSGVAADVDGAFSDNGFNLIGDASSSTGFVTSVLVGDLFSPVPAGLGPLKSFGNTQGHEPQFGSFAINNGGAGAPFDDQRGANRGLGGVADVGAIEFLVNNAPGFSAGPAVSVEGDGAVTIAGWASNISAGASFESGQVLTFVVVGPTYAFREAPFIDPVTGNLSFRPDRDADGSFVFDVYLVDDGGTAGGGSNSSPAAVLVISVNNDDDDDKDDLCTTGGKGGTSWLILAGLVAALGLGLRRVTAQ